MNSEADVKVAPRPGLPRLASAVLWSFFGVRKRRNMEADITSLNPLHIIAAGLLGAALFVATLITLVRYITH